MRELFRLLTIPLLLLLAPPAIAAPAPAAAVDAAIVGTWKMIVQGPAGPSNWFWEIRDNGTYTFHSEGGAPAPSHSGIVTFNAGAWSIVATQGLQWRDGGTYRLGNPNLLIANGVLGAGVWDRQTELQPEPQQQAIPAPPRQSAPPQPPAQRQAIPAPPRQNVPRQQQASPAPPRQSAPPQPAPPQQQANPAPERPSVPPNTLDVAMVPFEGYVRNDRDLIKTAIQMSARWRKDAVLSEVRIVPRFRVHVVYFGFYSPSDGSGIEIASNTSGWTSNNYNSGPSARVTEDAVELSTAMYAVRNQGSNGDLVGQVMRGADLQRQAFTGELGIQLLRGIYLSRGLRVLAWQIQEESRDLKKDTRTHFVDALSGKLLPGDIESNRANISPAWQEAANNYRAFAEKQLGRPSTAPAGFVPPPSGLTCVIGAACRALVAKDNAAADRIDSGYPTADDIAKYAK